MANNKLKHHLDLCLCPGILIFFSAKHLFHLKLVFFILEGAGRVVKETYEKGQTGELRLEEASFSCQLHFFSQQLTPAFTRSSALD